MSRDVNLVTTFFFFFVEIGLSAMCVKSWSILQVYNQIYSISILEYLKQIFCLLILSLRSKSRACLSYLAKEIKPRKH